MKKMNSLGLSEKAILAITPVLSVANLHYPPWTANTLKFEFPQKKILDKNSVEYANLQKWLVEYDFICKWLWTKLVDKYGTGPINSGEVRLNYGLQDSLVKVNEIYLRLLDEHRISSNITPPKIGNWCMWAYPDRWCKFFKRLRKLNLVTFTRHTDEHYYHFCIDDKEKYEAIKSEICQRIFLLAL